VNCYEGCDERVIIETFLSVLSLAVRNGRTVCGFNILGFDLPFIRRRCIILGIPFEFYNRENKWQPWAFSTYDAMLDWQCGNYRDANISLDTLSRALGVGKKTGSGADFAKLYAEDRDAALAYLRNDVLLTDAVCERMFA